MNPVRNYCATRRKKEVSNGVKIITVSGAHSGVGKTKVAEALLGRFKNWSALKVTVTHRGGACPVHKDCPACGQLQSDFSIISNKDIIETEGKDTQRFKSAGAKEVLWLKSKPAALEKGIKCAISLFKKTKGLIIETNSALKYLKPDLAILVKSKDSVLPAQHAKIRSGIPPEVLGDWRDKPSAKEILGKVDLTITV